jgi:hypothetical protein
MDHLGLVKTVDGFGESIVATGFQYRSGSIPISVVATLIKNVWAHMDREARDDGVDTRWSW